MVMIINKLFFFFLYVVKKNNKNLRKSIKVKETISFAYADTQPTRSRVQELLTHEESMK